MAQYIGLGDENFGGLEDFCDAVLKTEDGYCFKVHRVILSKNSIYFRALFLFGGSSRSAADFSLSWFSGRTVKQVLNYLYYGKIPLEIDNIVELLLAADYFLLDDLLRKCQVFAKENLSLKNCVKIFVASHINNRLELYKASRRFIRFNFSKLLDQQTNDIADIPFELFKILLEDGSLNIPDETYIWRAVEQWVSDCSERLPVAQEFLTTIRFHNLNQHLAQYILKSNILKKNPCINELKEFLLTMKWPEFSLLFKNVLSSNYPKTDFTRPRQPKKLYLIAKSFSKWNIAMTDLYVTYSEDLCMRRKVTLQARNNFWPNQMFVINHLAYMFDSWSGNAMIFNLLDNTWDEMQPMNSSRKKYTIVHKGQFLYAIGGYLDTFDESETSCAFEIYDTKDQAWKHLGSTVNSVTAASIGNKIYILGETPTSRIMTAEEYDTISGNFSEMPSPEISRTGFAMVAYENQLFVLAGLGDYGQLNSVEIFNPETRTWRQFQSLPYGLEYPNAKVVDDKLIVFDEAVNRPPVFWSKKEKVWKRYRSKCFKSVWKYLFYPIEHSDTISCLMNENLSYKQKWRTFEDDIC
ncbi:Kelch-like protein 10 like protein [Argiope bruennichi]|uniref:Kelch-like protein diablo n=1 Tax=Argiope bruennichi TaxID=94029 RepID=A0A8T0FFJ1_ARGBR|nr:Kelch-like protein 10 like protein [Argiope bruennichi]